MSNNNNNNNNQQNKSTTEEGTELHSFVANLPKDPPTYDFAFNFPTNQSHPPPYPGQGDDTNSTNTESDIESLVPSWDQLPSEVVNPRRFLYSSYYDYDDFYEDDYEYADYEEIEPADDGEGGDEEDFLLYHTEPSNEIQVFQQMDRHTILRALSLTLSVVGSIISLYSCASFFTAGPAYEQEYVQVCSSVQATYRLPNLCYSDVYEKEHADVCYPVDVIKTSSLGEYPQTAIIVLIFLFSVSGFSLFLSYWAIGCRQIDACQGFTRFLELIALPLVLLLTLMAVWGLQLLSENDFWKVVQFYWENEELDCKMCTWSTGNTLSNTQHGVYSYYLIYNITAFSNMRHNYTKESIDWNRDLYLEVRTDLERVLSFGVPCCILGVLALFVSKWFERSRVGLLNSRVFYRRRNRRRRRRTNNTTTNNTNNNNSENTENGSNSNSNTTENNTTNNENSNGSGSPNSSSNTEDNPTPETTNSEDGEGVGPTTSSGEASGALIDPSIPPDPPSYDPPSSSSPTSTPSSSSSPRSDPDCAEGDEGTMLDDEGSESEPLLN